MQFLKIQIITIYLSVRVYVTVLFQDLLLAGCKIDDQSTNTSSTAICMEYIGIQRWLGFFMVLFEVWFFWCVVFRLSFFKSQKVHMSEGLSGVVT